MGTSSYLILQSYRGLFPLSLSVSCHTPMLSVVRNMLGYANCFSWPSLHMNNIRESLIKKGHNLREIPASHNIESW